MKYLFGEPLTEGLIKSRPNRFIMYVMVDGKLEKCHCPSTGRIGSIKFEDIPCLLSRSKNPERMTKYTVEAFSLDEPGKKSKSWIGINQTKANEYVEFFIKAGLVKNMLGKVSEVKREVKLGRSRIDFLINGRDYLEVKTPLMIIPTEGHRNHRENNAPLSNFDRMIKHFEDVSHSINGDSRAIILLCNIYNADPFKVPVPKGKEGRIIKAARKARHRGLENWQINLRINREGVSLLDCFRLNLF
jgi:sugar fermentation stimulation protein A